MCSGIKITLNPIIISKFLRFQIGNSFKKTWSINSLHAIIPIHLRQFVQAYLVAVREPTYMIRYRQTLVNYYWNEIEGKYQNFVQRLSSTLKYNFFWFMIVCVLALYRGASTQVKIYQNISVKTYDWPGFFETVCIWRYVASLYEWIQEIV